jgi:nicotinamide-nucleotide amidase
MIRVEIIATGNELLKGETINTTTPFMAGNLRDLGYEITRTSTLRDQPDEIIGAIREALSRADIVLLTGGLGPTPDDLTRDALAEAVSQPLEFQPDIWAEIQSYFRKTGRSVPPANMNQAYLPYHAQAVPNKHGTAPGILVSYNSQTIVALPGPPNELQSMFNESVLPYLSRNYPPQTFTMKRTFKVCGLGESHLLEKIGEVLPLVDNDRVRLSYLPKGGEVHLTLQVEGDDQHQAKEIFTPMAERINALLGADLYGLNEETLAGRVGSLLRQRGYSLATAESCTGGLAAHLVTEVPGSSDYFRGGVIAYSNEVKEKVLGVSPDTLAAVGAVSQAIACEMAEGVRNLLAADIGLSTTGFAGPEGGSPENPVGTVYIGLATPGGTSNRKLYWPGQSRYLIKLLAAKLALDYLRREISGDQADEDRG